MSAHTPGPWRIHENPTGGASVETESVSIADVKARGGVPFPTQEHCLANARLIAAAPDLLDALNELLGFACTTPGAPAHSSMEKARTALKKARGA
jgi:hypothetical protein